MRWFLDTSVLVAACVRRHPHFPRASTVFRSVLDGEAEGVISRHSVAELFSALTALPLQPRISPAEAELLVTRNILPRFRFQDLSLSMYEAAIRACASRSLPAGHVYDALLIECARAAECDRIYTFNVVDFRALAPDLADRITAP
jgi:predicted nucleic acid-binding protein